MSYATTMLGRNVKHTVRNPVAVFNAVLFPIILLLMFVYVIGGAFDIGGNYIDYATPDLDEGPIIEQVLTRVDHNYRVDQLTRVGRDNECLALATAVNDAGGTMPVFGKTGVVSG